MAQSPLPAQGARKVLLDIALAHVLVLRRRISDPDELAAVDRAITILKLAFAVSPDNLAELNAELAKLSDGHVRLAPPKADRLH